MLDKYFMLPKKNTSICFKLIINMTFFLYFLNYFGIDLIYGRAKQIIK